MIVSLTGQKGGVGKSTLAASLAVESRLRGRSTLLVDADPQGTVLRWRDRAAEVEGSERWMPTVIAMNETMHRPDQLPRIAGGFDDVFIDCPGRIDGVQRAAMVLSDVVCFPCQPTPADAWALKDSIELLNVTRDLTGRQITACVVFSRKKSNSISHKNARDSFSDGGVPILNEEIGDRVAFQEVLASGTGITQYAPKDPAAKELRAFFDALVLLSESKDGDK